MNGNTKFNANAEEIYLKYKWTSTEKQIKLNDKYEKDPLLWTALSALQIANENLLLNC